MAEFFNDSDAVEDITQGTQRQRKPRREKTPRQKRMLPKPLLRLILVIVAVIVVIVIIVVAVTATRGGNETAQYQTY
ncbi:hypothetical protein NL526_30495, partial [Klebsiella pneumoniae]|nr:hypothetical protein [Klebsiella pneumoniae]